MSFWSKLLGWMRAPNDDVEKSNSTDAKETVMAITRDPVPDTKCESGPDISQPGRQIVTILSNGRPYQVDPGSVTQSIVVLDDAKQCTNEELLELLEALEDHWHGDVFAYIKQLDSDFNLIRNFVLCRNLKIGITTIVNRHSDRSAFIMNPHVSLDGGVTQQTVSHILLFEDSNPKTIMSHIGSIAGTSPSSQEPRDTSSTGSNIKTNSNTSELIKAAKAGNYAKVKQLIADGADPMGSDEQGLTPLWYAACEGNMAIGRLLLDSGADNGNKSSGSPLHIATSCGHSDFVSLLLKAGVDPDAPDSEGHSALYNAQLLHMSGTAERPLGGVIEILQAHGGTVF